MKFVLWFWTFYLLKQLDENTLTNRCHFPFLTHARYYNSPAASSVNLVSVHYSGLFFFPPFFFFFFLFCLFVFVLFCFLFWFFFLNKLGFFRLSILRNQLLRLFQHWAFWDIEPKYQILTSIAMTVVVSSEKWPSMCYYSINTIPWNTKHNIYYINMAVEIKMAAKLHHSCIELIPPVALLAMI